MYRFRTAAAALFALGIALSACTNSGNSSSESSASPEASASGAAEASPAASASATSGAESSPATNAGTPVNYTDLSGTFGEKQISELAALGVFGTPSGTFNPTGTITRGDFVKWLVLANNAIFADNAGKQIRPSQGATSSYPDVGTSHPDFPYIQGMYDAGFAVGFPDKTFKPDALLTHEQMIAIKESVDRGGVQQYYVANWDSTLPNWKDKQQINKLFRGAIAEDGGLDRVAVVNWNHPNLVIDNVPRTFGAIAMFRPQDNVTRSQAALVLWKMGAHTDHVSNPTPDDVPRSAADALAPPTPTPTP
ncbi:MAG TPA: S-layer homology domain-containing protein [Candidatus Nitrosotalea sp.]|nr:S-layer homology domain-containing protein [Candidatus Nitrosotalea sp.]